MSETGNFSNTLFLAVVAKTPSDEESSGEEAGEPSVLTPAT